MILLSSAIILISIILDQATKIAADKFLSDGSINIIPNILTFSHVKNPGAAFGILSDDRWVFMIFSTISIVVMVYLMFKLKSPSYFFNISLSMLVGGGIGNMIDRVFRGYVVDFLKVDFIDFPVFNVADCFVTVGAVLLAIYLIFFYDEKENVNKDKNSETQNIAYDDSMENENIVNSVANQNIAVDNFEKSQDIVNSTEKQEIADDNSKGSQNISTTYGDKSVDSKEEKFNESE